ncbi:glycoside hydrolase/phage tail family protein [Brevundimonas sp. GCM10030266]|uniref:baseplate multidomain protein megatron n=1 Tax=Brevundimonas sp. GCM10030266 TaxID=3273386 RepID=UPI003607C958
MAQVILGGIGQALGGPLGKAVGGIIGQGLDRSLVAGLETPRQRGPRLESLKIQGSAEGAPLCCVFGRARVTGTVIWAARFREDRHTSSPGKGAPRRVEYGYSLSFAVAVCEGEIDGIGRIWADGQPMDVSSVAFRVHRGGEDQNPDPLIEAVEGDAPAYRGTAYVVFEDLPLGAFGNRVPQLAFEVFHRPRGQTPGLEDRLEGVCLIPGAGEFVLATEPVMRREGLTRTLPENVHGGGAADLLTSLDLLQAQLPNLKRVSLVIGWFGDDLRAAHCRVRPGVERRDKLTEPLVWTVAGLDRAEAHLISGANGGPAYGGTPSDDTVRQAITELKSRGLEVTLYPFLFMDMPEDNSLPGLEGEARQAAYPWRGRVRGRDGAEADADVEAMFGTAGGWGLRRLALHYARMAADAGADGLLIGSEMRGLTLTRNSAGDFPAVAALQTLAAECRVIVGPNVKLSYAADWSEYAGSRADGEVRFHLDPLWADPNVDYVGIDWYPPLGDWRAGDGGLDADAYAGPDDPAYLAAQIAGGEGFDWFYENDLDRLNQIRTPVIDTHAGEDWVFRVKDLAGWWGHAHHERSGGLRDETPTAWIPGMKPIRLTEFGCGAVDRGGNAPNLFVDPKSVETALPPFSTGARDDRMQRRALEATLAHFETGNPVSGVYGGPMLEAADAWCWDARPWPAFPARQDVWADASAWRRGHWLNGRLHGETRDLIEAILKRGGVEVSEIGPITGEVQGYVIDRPMPTKDALAPLVGALGLHVAERGGDVALTANSERMVALSQADLAMPDEGQALQKDRKLDRAPTAARVRFIDGDRDYRTSAVLARTSGDGGGVDLDFPAVCGRALAETAAQRALHEGAEARLVARLGPLASLRLEPGDVVGLAGQVGDWRVARLDFAEAVSAELEPVLAPMAPATDDEAPTVAPTDPAVGAPFLRMLETPPLPGGEDDPRPFAVVAGMPWRPQEVRAGASATTQTVRVEVARSATVGTLTSALRIGARYRWNAASLTVRVEGRAPESRPTEAVLAGANSLAVETPDGWELVQFRDAQLVGDDVWRLSGLLRAQRGTEAAMRVGAEPGAVVVFLDDLESRASLSPGERGLPLIWRASPVGSAGGGSTTEVRWIASGIHERPFSPAHLRATPDGDGGLRIDWTPRDRLDADGWGAGVASGETSRFRVSVVAGDGIVRARQVEATSVTYDATDFPDGLSGEVTVSVAQWAEGYGWGEQARISL